MTVRPIVYARPITPPPTVIGYVDRPFLTIGHANATPDVWCPIHAPTRVEWPSRSQPIYAGDVLPLHHDCVECGLDINDLDPRRQAVR